MHLSDHDLRQLDDAALEELSEAQARAWLAKVVADLKAARERLGQHPGNSSRPPSSQAPWASSDTADAAAADARVADAAEERASDGDDEASSPDKPARQPRQSAADTGEAKRPGRRKGAPGQGRPQQLPIAGEQPHAPTCCARCGRALAAARPTRAYPARDQIDLVEPDTGAKGLMPKQTKHTYVERPCACGHWPRAESGRCAEEESWTVALTEWHLAGPTLVAFIIALTQRMRLSRARVQGLLYDWLGLALSTSTINQCLHEGGRAVAPVVPRRSRPPTPQGTASTTAAVASRLIKPRLRHHQLAGGE